MAVIFDLGAVVFRWEPIRLLQQALPLHAPDDEAAAELARRFFQSFDHGSDWSEFDRGRVELPELVSRLSARLGLRPDEVAQVIAAIPSHLALLPATVALLQRLKAMGERLFYLSNMPAAFTAQVGSLLQDIDVFEDGVFSADVGLIKPEPAIYRLAAERFGLPASQCRFLDDAAVNVEAARAQGWTAWQFVDAAQAAVDLGLDQPARA